MGLFFTALLGILHIGKGLKAPFKISGEWHISIDSARALKNTCSSFQLSPENSEAVIEQSGVYLTMIIGNNVKTKFSGKIDNQNLSLSEVGNNDNRCISVMHARLIKGNNHSDELKGVLYSPGCKDCPEVSFSAVRLH